MTTSLSSDQFRPLGVDLVSDENTHPYLSLEDSIIIQRIHLKSGYYGYFSIRSIPPNPPGFSEPPFYQFDPDYQTFSISRDGVLKVENKAEHDPRSITLESIKIPIDPEIASRIIDRIVMTLKNAPFVLLICDGPSWDMVLTDTEGHRHVCSGCMWADPEYEGKGLSKYIREELDRFFLDRKYSIFDTTRLALFDGIDEDD